MNPGDREILELNELCGAVVDGTLSEAQRARLAALLRESETARRHYVRAMGQSASLHGYAAENHAEAPDRPNQRRRTFLFPRWLSLALPAAAAIAVAWVMLNRNPLPDRGAAAARGEFVARLTGAKDSLWGGTTGALPPGTPLRRGQKIELSAGYAEITFDSGARLVLEGAAALDVNSAWDATLRHGTLKASVPPEALGFRVSNRYVDVIDLGTEFTMIADATGGAEVLVNKGEVEAAPRTGGETETILLRENEARRFAESGVSAVSDRERKFALFSEPLDLKRHVPSNRHAHWSFDGEAGEPRIELLATPGTGSEVRLEGPRGRALQFDGRMYAKADFPGVSGSGPRTVAFWVRVPEEAQPLDTWMVAWGTSLPKLGQRPVHISWNRRPAEGALGALRTDFGGGHAIGTTSLRDGKWHHVAVYFSAGDSPGAPVQVKQYVDGRLESNATVSGVVRGPAGTGDATLADTVWLGYRLTDSKQEGRRFRGELDELFIADRGLEPNEIVSLMKHNRLPSALASTAER